MTCLRNMSASPNLASSQLLDQWHCWICIQSAWVAEWAPPRMRRATCSCGVSGDAAMRRRGVLTANSDEQTAHAGHRPGTRV